MRTIKLLQFIFFLIINLSLSAQNSKNVIHISTGVESIFQLSIIYNTSAKEIEKLNSETLFFYNISSSDEIIPKGCRIKLPENNLKSEKIIQYSDIILRAKLSQLGATHEEMIPSGYSLAENKGIINLGSIKVREMSDTEKKEVSLYVPFGFVITESNLPSIKQSDYLIKINQKDLKDKWTLNQVVRNSRELGTVEVEIVHLTMKGFIKKENYKSLLSFSTPIEAYWNKRTEIPLEKDILNVYKLGNRIFLFSGIMERYHPTRGYDGKYSKVSINEIIKNSKTNKYELKSIVNSITLYRARTVYLYQLSNELIALVFGKRINEHILLLNLNSLKKTWLNMNFDIYEGFVLGTVKGYPSDNEYGTLLLQETKTKKLFNPTGQLVGNPPYDWSSYSSSSLSISVNDDPKRFNNKGIKFVSPITEKKFYLASFYKSGLRIALLEEKLDLHLKNWSKADSYIDSFSNSVPVINSKGTYFFDLDGNGQVEWLISDRNKLYIVPTNISIR